MGRRVIYRAPPAVLAAQPRTYAQAYALLTSAGVPDGTEVILYGPTGQRVCALQRMGASDVRVSSSEILLYNASAATLPPDDVAIAPEGATADPTWGAPGSESTGGLILPEGELSLPFCGSLPGKLLDVSARMVVSIGGSPADGDAIGCGAYRDSPSRVIWGGVVERIGGAYTRQYVIGVVGSPSPGGSTGPAYQEPSLANGDALWVGRKVIASDAASNEGGVIAGAWREAGGGGDSQQAFASTSSAITANDAQTAWLWRSASNLGARVTRLVLSAPRVP